MTMTMNDDDAEDDGLIRVPCEWICPLCGQMETDELARDEHECAVAVPCSGHAWQRRKVGPEDARFMVLVDHCWKCGYLAAIGETSPEAQEWLNKQNTELASGADGKL